MFVRPTGWDDGLNDAQLAAVTHGDGPLVIVAGAGTGKTRTLTSRLALLLERGASPQAVLLLTFTRRAAELMMTRAAFLAGLSHGERPVGGTFHSVAHRHVAAYAEVLGISPQFGVLDPGGASDLMDIVRVDLGHSAPPTRFPRSSTLVEIYSRCVNTGRTVSDVVAAHYPWCDPHTGVIAEIFRHFTARKRRSHLLDFDDLLVHWLALLRDEGVSEVIAGRYSHVLVDEYQDVNALQSEIVERLCPSGEGLTLVGDEAQAIYGFRGADPRHLRHTAESLSGVTVVKLEENYRSLQSILDVANVIRPEDGPRVALRGTRGVGATPVLTRCHDAIGEARRLAEAILEAHERGVALQDQAILVRAAHHSDLIEIELTARRIPYRKYGGLRFLEAAHVRDFVAAARLLDNPTDEVAWYRVLRLHRSIGPARARRLISSAMDSGHDALEAWMGLVGEVPRDAQATFRETLVGLREARDLSGPARRCERLVVALEPLWRDRYRDVEARLGDLTRLAAAADTVEDLGTWLADLTLDPPSSSGDLAGSPRLDEDYVVISTIHSAKGLEWPIVHIPHVIDGFIPVDMALTSPEGLAEERRLFYVAVTRAADELHLYSPQRMPVHRFGRDDRHGLAPMSRFIDHAVTERLEIHDDGAVGVSVAPGSGHRVTVGLDDLWT